MDVVILVVYKENCFAFNLTINQKAKFKEKYIVFIYILWLLQDHGADINHMTSENTSLLHHAAIEGHVPMAAKLLELGVEVCTYNIFKIHK